jgi:hypothetical protein
MRWSPRAIHSAKVGETLDWAGLPSSPSPCSLLPFWEKGSRKSFLPAHFGSGEPKECGGLDEICVMDRILGEVDRQFCRLPSRLADGLSRAEVLAYALNCLPPLSAAKKAGVSNGYEV